MPLWGDRPTSNHVKPIYVKTRSGQANVFATNAGWVLKRKDGTRETLVAIENLAVRMSNANITSVEWSFSNVARVSGGVWVTYDEEVKIIGANTPTLLIQVANASVSNITASYSKGNGNNRLLYTFTAPFGAQVNVANNASLVISNGTFLVTSNTNTTINDKIGGNVAYLVAANSVPFAAGSIPFVNLANANITAIAFSATSTINNAAVSNVVVTYDQDVMVIGANTPTFNLSVANSNTAGLNVTASLIAGNTTGNLVFSYTVPNLATANVANVPTLSILSASPIVANTNDTLNGALGGKVTSLTPSAAITAAAGRLLIK